MQVECGVPLRQLYVPCDSAPLANTLATSLRASFGIRSRRIASASADLRAPVEATLNSLAGLVSVCSVILGFLNSVIRNRNLHFNDVAVEQCLDAEMCFYGPDNDTAF